MSTLLSCICIPIVKREINDLLNNLILWETTCFNDSVEEDSRLTLVISINNGLDQTIKDAVFSTLDTCPQVKALFSDIVFYDCELEGHEDLYIKQPQIGIKYPYGTKSGPNTQFFKTIKFLHQFGGSALYIETDCVIVKNKVIEAANSLCTTQPDYYVYGSRYRGPGKLSLHVAEHINGNAIYHVGSQAFQQFIVEVWEPLTHQIIQEMPNIAYDVVLAYAKYNNILSVDQLLEIKQKIIPTDFIQNHGGGYENRIGKGIAIGEIIKNEDIYIIHGKHFYSEYLNHLGLEKKVSIQKTEQAFREEGTSLVSKGAIKEAADCYMEGCEQHPNSFFLHHKAALTLDRLEGFYHALFYWNRLLEISETTAYLHLKKGNCLLKLNRLEEALTWTKEGIIAYPENEYLINLVERIYLSKGAALELIDYLRQLSTPNRNQKINQLLDKKIGRLLLERVSIYAAIQHALSCLKKYPEAPLILGANIVSQLGRNGYFNELLHIIKHLSWDVELSIEDWKTQCQIIEDTNHLNDIFNNRQSYFDYSLLPYPLEKAKVLSNLDQTLREALQRLVKQTKTTVLESNIQLYQKTIEEEFSLIDTYSRVEEIMKVTQWLRDRIKRQIPTSFIRLGDGEGSFLPYRADNLSHQIKDQYFIKKIWCGRQELDLETLSFFQEELQEAVIHADLLGVPPLRRLVKDLQCYIGKDNNRRIVRNISNIYDFVSSHINQRSTLLTSSHLHTDLESFNLYRQLFSELDTCGIITCHPKMEEILRDRYGIASVELFLIPGEHKYAANWDGIKNENHYPTYFNQLKNYAWEAGKVYLVAAGFLGKLYCHAIKKQGGIALDIGAIVDYWCGYKTRDFHENLGLPKGVRLQQNIATWKRNVPNNIDLVPNPSFNYFSDRVGKVSAPASQEPLIPKELLVMAHPRSGTGYMAKLFQNLGLDIGHETMGAAGLSSWQMVVPDSRSLRFQYQLFRSEVLPQKAYDFNCRIHLIRDPRKAIPSIQLENVSIESWNYRKTHIFRFFKVDIDQYTSSLEKAIASYYYWNKLIASSNPDYTVRLEQVAQDLHPIFAKHYPSLVSKLAEGAFITDKVNQSTAKHFLSKPEWQEADVAQCDPQLIADLNELIRGYGYAKLGADFPSF